MPAASPLQLTAAAWAGVVADHDDSIIAAVTRRLRRQDEQKAEPIDDKYVHGIAHLRAV
jgi:hypothetical protein